MPAKKSPRSKPAAAPALTQRARRLSEGLTEAVTHARQLSHSLAPVALEGEGLMRGLQELAASASRHAGMTCRFRCTPPVLIQDITTATNLYRIAQEAVNNALKHGQAKRIDLRLTERSGQVELSVANTGRALPTAQNVHDGIGLHVMHYRAEAIGARLTLQSGPVKGVRVTCILPRKT
jgi:signal transduction histidine kinase